MKKLAFVAFILLFATSAWATRLSYTLVSASGDMVNFFSPQQPTPMPCTFLSSCFSISPDFLALDNIEVGNAIVNFYQSGGLTILSGRTLLVNNAGPALFVGGLSTPTLQTFSNLRLVEQPLGHPQYDDVFFLNASVSPAPNSNTPEPATWELGVLALALFGGSSTIKLTYPVKDLDRRNPAAVCRRFGSQCSACDEASRSKE